MIEEQVNFAFFLSIITFVAFAIVVLICLLKFSKIYDKMFEDKVETRCEIEIAKGKMKVYLNNMLYLTRFCLYNIRTKKIKEEIKDKKINFHGIDLKVVELLENIPTEETLVQELCDYLQEKERQDAMVDKYKGE